MSDEPPTKCKDFLGNEHPSRSVHPGITLSSDLKQQLPGRSRYRGHSGRAQPGLPGFRMADAHNRADRSAQWSENQRVELGPALQSPAVSGIALHAGLCDCGGLLPPSPRARSRRRHPRRTSRQSNAAPEEAPDRKPILRDPATPALACFDGGSSCGTGRQSAPATGLSLHDRIRRTGSRPGHSGDHDRSTVRKRTFCRRPRTGRRDQPHADHRGTGPSLPPQFDRR
jgi:hypothetical protein